jgi:hypothetical protein
MMILEGLLDVLWHCVNFTVVAALAEDTKEGAIARVAVAAIATRVGRIFFIFGGPFLGCFNTISTMSERDPQLPSTRGHPKFL